MEKENKIYSLEQYKSTPFFLKCRFNKIELYLELQLNEINLFQEVSHLLTDKSKRIIKILEKYSYENNREVINKILESLVEELWKK